MNLVDPNYKPIVNQPLTFDRALFGIVNVRVKFEIICEVDRSLVEFKVQDYYSLIYHCWCLRRVTWSATIYYVIKVSGFGAWLARSSASGLSLGKINCVIWEQCLFSCSHCPMQI